MPAAGWVEVFRECLETPDRSHLIRANVAFDFRQIAGALDVTPPLVAMLREAKEHPDLIRRLARMATDFKPPLGRRGSQSLEKSDADRQQHAQHDAVRERDRRDAVLDIDRPARAGRVGDRFHAHGCDQKGNNDLLTLV